MFTARVSSAVRLAFIRRADDYNTTSTWRRDNIRAFAHVNNCTRNLHDCVAIMLSARLRRRTALCSVHVHNTPCTNARAYRPLWFTMLLLLLLSCARRRSGNGHDRRSRCEDRARESNGSREVKRGVRCVQVYVLIPLDRKTGSARTNFYRNVVVRV